MFQLKQNQIFMICESLLFILIAYHVYSYIHSLNTRINNLNNKLVVIETFLQQSDISIPVQNSPEQSPEQSPEPPVQKSPEPPVEANIPTSFNILNEEDLVKMMSSSFNSTRKNTMNIEEIEDDTTEEFKQTTPFTNDTQEQPVQEVEEVEEEIEEEIEEVEEVEEVEEEIEEVEEEIEEV